MTMMTVLLYAPLPLVVLVVLVVVLILVEATARRASRAFSTHRLGFATTTRGWSAMTLRLVVRQNSRRVRAMTFHWFLLRFVGIDDRVPAGAVGRLGKELRQRNDFGRSRFRRRRGERRRIGIMKSTNDSIGAQPAGPTGSSRRRMGALVPRCCQARCTKLIRRHKTRTKVHLPLLLKKQYTRRKACSTRSMMCRLAPRPSTRHPSLAGTVFLVQGDQIVPPAPRTASTMTHQSTMSPPWPAKCHWNNQRAESVFPSSLQPH
jgi:hypothetical protein